MRPHQLTVALSVSIMLGVALASHFPWGLTLWLSITIVIAGFIYFPYHKALCLVASVALLGGGLRYYQAHEKLVVNAPLSEVGKPIEVTGFIYKIEPSGGGQSQIYTKLNNPSNKRVMIQAWADDRILPGDELTAVITRQPDPEHWGWLFKDGFTAIYQLDDLKSHNAIPVGTPLRMLHQLRAGISNQISGFLPEPASQLINGLLLGLRAQMPEEMRDQLQRSGTTHIVALSGTNITLILYALVLVLSSLPRRLKFLIVGLAILAFIIMSGLSSSVVRAAAMGWLFLLGSVWGRKVNLPIALLVAASAMVMINPFILQYDIGFQLSVFATAGLIFLTPLIQKWLEFIPRMKFFTDILAVTLAATIATLPLLVFHFGSLSTVSLVANLVIVPIVPIAMFMGLVGLLLSVLGHFAQPLAFIAWLPAHLIVELIKFFGNLPGASLEVPPIPPYLPVVCYLVIAAGAYVLHSKNQINRKPDSGSSPSAR